MAPGGEVEEEKADCMTHVLAYSLLCAPVLIMVKPFENASGGHGRTHVKEPAWSDYLLEVNDNSSQSLTVRRLF